MYDAMAPISVASLGRSEGGGADRPGWNYSGGDNLLKVKKISAEFYKGYWRFTWKEGESGSGDDD